MLSVLQPPTSLIRVVQAEVFDLGLVDGPGPKPPSAQCVEHSYRALIRSAVSMEPVGLRCLTVAPRLFKNQPELRLEASLKELVRCLGSVVVDCGKSSLMEDVVSKKVVFPEGIVQNLDLLLQAVFYKGFELIPQRCHLEPTPQNVDRALAKQRATLVKEIPDVTKYALGSWIQLRLTIVCAGEKV